MNNEWRYRCRKKGGRSLTTAASRRRQRRAAVSQARAPTVGSTISAEAWGTSGAGPPAAPPPPAESGVPAVSGGGRPPQRRWRRLLPQSASRTPPPAPSPGRRSISSLSIFLSLKRQQKRNRDQNRAHLGIQHKPYGIGKVFHTELGDGDRRGSQALLVDLLGPEELIPEERHHRRGALAASPSGELARYEMNQILMQ